MTAVPEEIALPEVGARLRRHRVDDVDALLDAVEESRDHLRPHMPWADESRAELAAFVAEAVQQWATGRDRNFVIEDVASGELLGGCGLHARVGADGLEIGYWLRAGATGRGRVTAAARALTEAALAVDGVTRVEIHCDEANVASAAVPRRLGYRLDRIERDVVSAPGDLGRSMIWVWPTDTVNRSRLPAPPEGGATRDADTGCSLPAPGTARSMAYVCREFDASAADLFRVVTDPETYPHWLIGTEEIRDVDDSWPAVGSRFRHRVGIGPLALPDHSEVLAIEDGELLRLRVMARPFIAAVVTFRVVGDDGRCVLTMEEEPARRIIGNVVRPILDPVIHLRNHRSLRRLDELVGARQATP